MNVTEVESENEIEVQRSEYDIYKKTKQYKDFREEKTEFKIEQIRLNEIEAKRIISTTICSNRGY